MVETPLSRTQRIELLPQTAPDTPMGQLLRKFWHPIALSQDVPAGQARPLRVLSEDLTIYRGASGKAYLVAGRCAHRCSVLHTGWVQEEQIQCMYHGWTYDGTGLCIDIPAEKQPRSKPIRIAGYPVREYAGLLFAYLGSGEAPEFDLPKKDVFDDPARLVLAKKEVWDCNWFQQIENSMDAVHLNFAHHWGAVGQFGSRITGAGNIPDLDYEETSSGIRQIATRSKDNVRISDWTFPNNNHVVAPGPEKDDPWAHISAWPVPVDDHSTMRFTLYSIDERDPDKIEELRSRYDLDYDPAHHSERLFAGDVSGVSEPGLISVQDYVAVRGQGVIFDRSQENLSTSDAGVVFLRRIFLRELEALREGLPTKHWQKLKQAVHLKAPPKQAAE
ncbi:Rieske 2Fe-2S domain-containing protein [Roseiarcaceae bacterium H3SJ34-1]|uniref:Rieske 2Fe-2S domain-containing protein n=1 Tax=Terripilifer ovatus TaxID=3032367 RepID=UPI003AB92EA1|nr:Rieske 2Fe-2S domain-containing protein [Roseiarcaceae bacterium H3SJ34-1]